MKSAGGWESHESKLYVIKKDRAYDESEKIFEKKKAKEKEKFMQRYRQAPWSPGKLEKGQPRAAHQVKETMDLRKKAEQESTGLQQYALEYAMPQHVFEDHYDEVQRKALA